MRTAPKATTGAFSPTLFLALAQGLPAAITRKQDSPIPAQLDGNTVVGAEDIRDILPPVEVPFWTNGKILIAASAALLALALLVWGIVFLIRKSRPVPVPPTPRAIALAELTRLRSPEGMGLGSRDFAARVAGVLRGFLEATHGVWMTRQTTEEFLSAIRADAKFSEAERDHLRRFLAHCDRFKFAGESVDEGMRMELIGIVEERVIGGVA